MPLAPRTLLVGSCLALLAAVACGGGSPAGPSAPATSGTAGPATSSSATIAGIVNGANAAPTSERAQATSAAAASGLTVTIVGKDLTANVDGSGYFQLANAPSGDVQLLFQGAGVNATVQLTGVGANELIEIVVSLSGGTATLVDEARAESKQSICHRTGAGAYNLISVSASAEPAHRAHGDAKVGEPVPGDTTRVFDAQCRAVGAGVEIEKSTNGHDANSAPGPKIPVGSTVTWTYVVTNTGTEPLTSVVVTDDRGVAVDCAGQTTVAAGQSITCTGTGTATAGQYRNVGTVTATAASGPVTDSDPSHYFGETEDTDGDEPKVELCHKTGNGKYNLIEVAVSAEPAHRNHGDAKIGEAVPGQVGKTFGPSCSVQ
jgi:hypothetical protein